MLGFIRIYLLLSVRSQNYQIDEVYLHCDF